MPHGSFICRFCGKPDWDRAPQYYAVMLGLQRQRRPISAAHLARKLDLNSMNVSNKLRFLEQLGFTRTVPGPNKHNRFLWEAVPVKERRRLNA